jgi:thiol-disulfide isomerase/thioredoxin
MLRDSLPEGRYRLTSRVRDISRYNCLSDSSKDLPIDFLSTPFGAALRPTIDSMYRRAPPGVPPRQPPPSATSAILQGIAEQAAATGSMTAPAPAAPTSTLTAPVQICSNPASLRTILSTHKAVTVFFTSATCGPCRMIEPVFEDLAHTKASPGIAFAKVDMGVGLGYQVAELYNVRVTPTFLFFVNGNLVRITSLQHHFCWASHTYCHRSHEMKGADAPELRSQVDFLIYEAFPREFRPPPLSVKDRS